jgi:hypothetical protein
VTFAASREDDPGPILRRVERLAWALVLPVAAAAGWWLGWRPALVLTVAAAGSMVSFRGLQRVVDRLRPRPDGAVDRPAGWWIALKLGVLIATFVAAVILGPDYLLALLLGISVLPLALITEAALETLHLLHRWKNRGS